MGSEKDYFAHPAISNSKLDWFEQSPAHYEYFMKHGKEDRPAYLVGSVSHTQLFEPDTFEKRYHKLDESKRPYPEQSFLNKENQKWRKEIIQAYSHKKIITLEEYDKVMFMMEAIYKCDEAKALLKDAVFEEEVFWTDPTTGLACKKKVDIRGKNFEYRADYKTSDNADPYKWQKKAWSMNYWRQAGYYGLEDQPEKNIPFWFIAQEKTPPYGVSVHLCTQQMIDYGKNRCMHLLGEIKGCKDADYWPSYEKKAWAQNEGKGYMTFDIPYYILQNL